MFFKPSKKLTIQQKYTPVTTFLSPLQKCNHRSFSASSLLPTSQKHTFSGSLRDQIRLDCFKKTVLTESKLNKTALSKATLKVQVDEDSKVEDLRLQLRALQLQLVRSKEQIAKLAGQHREDVLLITRQGQLIVQLEKELSLAASRAPAESSCECYQSEKYLVSIRNLQLKIRHLEEEKKEFKEEIRSLVVKQEELKHQLRLADEKCSSEVSHNRKLQDLLYEEGREQKENKRSRRLGTFGEEAEEARKKGRAKGEEDQQVNQNLRWCQDFLKRSRNHEIDKIESILKQ